MKQRDKLCLDLDMSIQIPLISKPKIVNEQDFYLELNDLNDLHKDYASLRELQMKLRTLGQAFSPICICRENKL